MTYYVKKGSSFHPADEANLDIRTALPAGNFIVKADMFGNFFFDSIDPFQIPPKLYGDTKELAERILNTYLDREVSTGVLLSGEKGSGKTLLAKVIAHMAKEKGFPSLVINTDLAGDKFNELIQDIEQPCIVLFDEFEKVYEPKVQKEMLTLLDGVFPTKKLFLFTVNDKWDVDVHLTNRPGRIFYSLEYKGLESEFITEYCMDNLKDPLKVHIPVLCQITTVFNAFNFDMLKAVVEEMNRYNETPQEVLKFINASPIGEKGSGNYAVNLVIDGKEIPEDTINTKEVQVNPLNIRHKLYVEYEQEDIVKGKKGEPDTTEIDTMYEEFTSDDLKKVETSAGKFVFINPSNATLILTRIKKEFSYTSLMA